LQFKLVFKFASSHAPPRPFIQYKHPTAQENVQILKSTWKAHLLLIHSEISTELQVSGTCRCLPFQQARCRDHILVAECSTTKLRI